MTCKRAKCGLPVIWSFANSVFKEGYCCGLCYLADRHGASKAMEMTTLPLKPRLY